MTYDPGTIHHWLVNMDHVFHLPQAVLRWDVLVVAGFRRDGEAEFRGVDPCGHPFPHVPKVQLANPRLHTS